MVAWYDKTNTTQELLWDAGEVDAGAPGAEESFILWNNRGGPVDVSDMENVRLTARDAGGDIEGDLVLGLWTEVRVDEQGEMEFTPVGGNTYHGLSNGITPGVIRGLANDGTLPAADPNTCLLTLRLNPAPGATPGSRAWLVGAFYRYV